jgi:hypothetical protein
MLKGVKDEVKSGPTFCRFLVRTSYWPGTHSFSVAKYGNCMPMACSLEIQKHCNSLIKLKATVTPQLPAGTAWLTANRYEVFLIKVKYRSMETIK